MKSPLFYFRHPSKLGISIINHMQWLPDSIFLRLRYRLEMGVSLNLKAPKTFQEKLQWLKLYNRKHEYTQMVDKYAVKEYVCDIIGEDHVIPTLGVWDKFDDINFDNLPDKFVLKTTHGGGSSGVVICKEKSCFDYNQAKTKLEKSLVSDIFGQYREWPYKNVPKRIIAEPFLEMPNHEDLTDYKFFCFNGEPKFLKVDFNRFTKHRANYYDLNWSLLPFGEAVFPPDPSITTECPTQFGKMIELARKLAKGHLFLRVDFYNVGEQIFFGELTFYPASGFGKFTSDEWELKVGNLLSLPISQ